nr:hypothetical protein [Tanacetum cinerariifolium]
MHSSSSYGRYNRRYDDHEQPSENYKDWLYKQYDEFPGPDSDDELPSKVIDNEFPSNILREMEVLKKHIGMLQEELTMLKSKSNFHDGI